MKAVDGFLNKITMYRLTLYVLCAYIVAAIILSFLGLLSYSPIDIGIQAGVAIISCYIFNFLFAKLFKAVTNTESVFITALILVCVFPVKVPVDTTLLALGSFAAMGAKYLLTVDKRHVFNPAAWAAMSVALITNNSAIWWVGTPYLLPIIFIGGLLVIRKAQAERMVTHFLIAYFFITIVTSFLHNGSVSAVFSTLQIVVLHTALFFFATIMLTEPLTSPSTKKLRAFYAYIVAVLYATPQLAFFGIVFTPEMALCIGNVYSFVVSPMYRLVLPLKEKINLGGNVFAFTFPMIGKFNFLPGQYMEWTLPHKKTDTRGNRRYFSMASSPTEKDMLIAVKYYTPASSYKKAMVDMQPGQEIIAASLSGDFVLPKSLDKPLVFVAGGIGVAPFRSMIQYIIDKNLQVNIVILYANRTADEMAFADVFEKAGILGVKTLYILTDTKTIPADWKGLTGHISGEMLQANIPDWKSRTFYISGPQLMVQSTESVLQNAGLPNQQIKTDYFPGY